MPDQYVYDLLRVSIAQICQTIGYNAIQTTPLELLQDNLHKFLHEFCRDLKRHVEHYNRTEPNLDDVCLTLAGLNINVSDMLEYIFNVQPIMFVVDIPKFPVYKESNLNFLKPGSKEVLIRPVHIFEHLPPILPSENNEEELRDSDANQPTEKCSTSQVAVQDVANIEEVKNKSTSKEDDECFAPLQDEQDLTSILKDSKKDSLTTFFKTRTSAPILDVEGHPAREIGSVIMTSGGFISPAIEGKLADSRIPDIIGKLDGLNALRTPTPRAVTSCHSSKSLADISTPALAISLVSSLKDQVITLSSLDAQTKKSGILCDNRAHQQVCASEDFASNSSCATSAAVTSRLPKKHCPTQHSNLQPPLAARILKKAKKKHTILPFPTHERTSQLHNTGHTSYPSESGDMNDKEQRKRMKILQKLVKSAKASGAEFMNYTEPNGKLKKIHGVYNSALSYSIPSGPESSQMEKILKKEAKHRQKLLKQQTANRDQPNIIANMEQTQQEIKIAENSKARLSENGSPTDHSTNFVSITPNSAGESKTFKKEEIKGINLLSGNISKSSPVSQNFLNSIPGFRGMKPGNISMPVFGEVAFVSEQSCKDMSVTRSPEIKLSNEPDRSKLNIFKKITSKQKQAKRSLSPTGNTQSQTQIYSGSESQVINLPSGTTITPASPTCGRHVYAPEDESFIIEDGNINSVDINTAISTTSLLARDSIIDVHVHSMQLSNKPKKRGRKPGSKNQPKVQGLYMMPTSTKKSKKFKYQKNIYGPPLQILADHNTEPLNLSHSFSLGGDVKSSIPLGNACTYPILDSKSTQRDLKERKGRKKTKVRSSPVASSAVGEDSNMSGNTTGMQRDSVKKSTDSSTPTIEEVDSINRKLLKIDTVLQPAPPAKQLSMTLTSNELLPSTKCNSSDSPVSKQRSSHQQITSGNLSLSTTPCESSLVPPVQKYPNLPPNILSMLPMYPFPPGPGLIPTPGLFPSILGSFSNNSSNPAPNMLLHGFLPFSGLKPSGNGNLLNSGMKIPEKCDNSAVTVSTGLERNYCNVAPLVPDSMKFKLSPSATGNSSVISPNHGNFGDRDASKILQLKQDKSLRDAIRDSLQKKITTLGTHESKSVCRKSIASTTGGVAFSNFDNLLRNANAFTPSSSIGFNESFRTVALLNNTEKAGINSSITSNSINDDSPIEVSDDSGDAPTSIDTHTSTKFKTSAAQRSFIKTPTLSEPLVEQMSELFVPVHNTKPTGVKPLTLSSNTNHEAKKLKKNRKSNSFDTRIPESYDGVSKLTGGADLIPLSGTELAYSSKIALSSSLTGISTSPTIHLSNKDYNTTDVLDTLTIISPSAMQDNHKDHKKIKKIKYGKIKKKKDKKEKVRNKEKFLEKRVMEKHSYKQSAKEFSKKTKKEKKREKQRSTMNNLPSSPSATTTNQNSAHGGFAINSTYLSNSHPFTASPVKITSSSSVVPKLTLKIGNCQSPTPLDDMKRTPAPKQIGGIATAITRDPSPELARISPLITRPPKQKSIGKDYFSPGACGNAPSEKKNSNCDLDFALILSPSQSYANTSIMKQNKEPQNCSGSSCSDSMMSSESIERQLKSTSPTDEEGNRVWICPACGKVDDGSAMIGCDGCDAWYHWVCVGILIAPKDNEDWFCRVCIARKKGMHSIDKKRKRNKKKIK